MYAHSAAWCQCSSRMPPAVSRILTPVMVVEIAKSAWVTCRAQPPSWMRRCTVLKEDQICGIAAHPVWCGGTVLRLRLPHDGRSERGRAHLHGAFLVVGRS